jgi:hypothetical protein
MRQNLALRSVGCALALAVCAAATACAAAGRDWKAFPAIIQLDTPADVFAIGDAHGDWQRLAKVLVGAKLIAAPPSAPDQVTWAGGGSVLVITGDMIDKGPDSLGVIALVRTLRSDAATRGGRVIITMGNHEAEFLADPGGSKTQEFRDELVKAHLDPKAVGECDGDIGAFLCTLPIAVRVNDWFFSHAGNSNGRTIDQLEAAIEAGAKNGFDTPELVGKNSILEARTNKQGPCGLPWFQDGCSKKHPERLLLPEYIKTLGIHHLVQGHQYGNVTFPDGVKRKKGRFYQRYGTLFLIDTGMSSGITDSDNSGGGALRITGSGNDAQAIVICPDGKDTILWSKDVTDHADKFCSRDAAPVN